ncbi:MAG: arylsulfatase [Pandoraea sp. 64-18]|nr:MAG: arylsulfatase [Pandoraea sp. 64-18]
MDTRSTTETDADLRPEGERRRAFLKTTGAALLSTSISNLVPATAAPTQHIAKSPPASPPTGYNVLFILVDQERYFDEWPMPVPGREKLKRRGISFVNHQIASCVCSPSRSNIYTGRHMQHTGIFDNAGLPWQPDLGQDVRTVGHMMKDAGYHSAYFGKWHLSATMHESRSPYDAPVADYAKTMRVYGFDDYFGVGDLVGAAHGGYMYDGTTTEAAVTWLRNRRPNASTSETSAKPWFLAVNLVNPHDAMWFDPAPSDKGHAGLLPTRGAPNDKLYETPWRNVPLPPSRKQPLNGQGRPAAHAMYGAAHAALIGRFDFSDRSVGLYQDNYLNCIRDCDRHVARILEELDNLGIADQTVVILTSDHGELGGYHQMIDKGANAYRQQNHVPFIVAHPAYEGGKQCSAITSHVDIAPTLLALAGLPEEKVRAIAGKASVGRSFAHLLKAPDTAPVDAVRPAALFNYAMLLYYDSEWMLAEFNTMRQRGVPPQEMHRRACALQPNLTLRGAIRSVFDGRYRFSRYFALSDFNRPTTLDALMQHNDLELYDLQSDPDEMNNLASQPGRYGTELLAMNGKLNALIDAEVGEDALSSLPFIDNRLQFNFRKHS